MADPIRFVVAGAIDMATLNTAAVFKEFADRLNAGILQILAGLYVIGTVIDDGAYREFELNYPLRTECEHHAGSQLTSVQRNELAYIFRNANRTCDVLNVTEDGLLNPNVAGWGYSEVTPLVSCAQTAALALVRLAEQASTST